MTRYDFSSAIGLLSGYINDNNKVNQIRLMELLFQSFLNDRINWDYALDNGQVCRWFRGQANISPQIVLYYQDDNDHMKAFSADISKNIFPLLYDSDMVVLELHTMLMQDTSVSEAKKKYLNDILSPLKHSNSATLAQLLFFAMERPFVKRDTKPKLSISQAALSPVTEDYIIGADAPLPCPYFCGRGAELTQLREELTSQGTIFLHGIAGIGKSELAKAYAKAYQKEYTNILYLTYTGSLKQNIAEMIFANDAEAKDSEERFQIHNRFLRSLKSDSLLIIDNFNTSATSDPLLSVVMKYRCHVIFTTRSRFNSYPSMPVTEIEDKSVILDFMGKYFSEAKAHAQTLLQIIDTVHSHTLAIELIARLLENGLLEPAQLLDRLQSEHTAMSASDTIDLNKDGIPIRDTYYNHIRTLFSLYKLTDEQQIVMENVALIPTTGISKRLFAHWLELNDLNIINELIEIGFLSPGEAGIITMHPMIQEVCISDLCPSITSCHTMLHAIQSACLLHGNEMPYYKTMFQTIENAILYIVNDDTDDYIRILEDVFFYMDNYHYQSGMQLIIQKLQELLSDFPDSHEKDKAILLECKAACAPNTKKAIKLEKEALSLIPEITMENAHLVANLHANLGGLYHNDGQIEPALSHMETAMQLFKEYDLVHMHDVIPLATNYATLLATTGDTAKSLSTLKKIGHYLKESPLSHDNARILEATGNVYLAIGNVPTAISYFKQALEIYDQLYEAEPQLIQNKKEEILQTFAQAGISYALNGLLPE